METYPLKIIDGHPVAEIGGRWFLVDTGSHATFGEGETVTILGEERSYQPDLLGIVSIGDVNQYVHTQIQAILGADVLATNYFAFDFEHKQFNISKEPLSFEGMPLDVELLLGVPFTRTTVAGTSISTVLDTGATICFLEPEHVDGLDSVGKKKDFFPTLGHFETEVYRSTIEFAGTSHTMKTGILPDNLRVMLGAIGAKAIIGTELFNYYDVCFALPENKIYLKPRPSRQATRVEVSIEHYGTTELQRPWTDRDLVEQVLLANDIADREFVERYRKLIFSTLRRFCGLPEDYIDDAFQHVFAKLFEDDCRRLRMWRGESKLSTYLVSIIINLGRDFRESVYARHARRQDPDYVLDDDRQHQAAEPPSPESETQLREMEEILGNLMASLEEICRKIIDLRYMREMSYQEISEALEISGSNVGVRLHRCLDALGRLMRERYPDLFLEDALPDNGFL